MLVYITLAERKSELEAAEMVNFLLAFKCIILQIRDKKKSMVPVFFFQKIKPKKYSISIHRLKKTISWFVAKTLY